MQLHVRPFLTAAIAGGAAGIGIGITLWAHAALATGGTPPAPVQFCFKNNGTVVYAASGTCPSGTTAIAPVAQQSGVVDLNNRLNTDEATIAILQSQATTAANNITTLQSQATTAANNITTLQGQVVSLQSLLGGVSRAPDANGYDTLTFSGMNVQVINGTKSEFTVNGLGNLIVGYADNFYQHPRTGSHNLITGDDGGWTSYGGLVAGEENMIFGPEASVSGGNANTASGVYSSVSGGDVNTSSAHGAWVGGGSSNKASNDDASVSGGRYNTADGVWAAVTGGRYNTASGAYDTVLGGNGNTMVSTYSCAYFPGSPTTSNC